jgi:protein TonB
MNNAWLAMVRRFSSLRSLSSLHRPPITGRHQAIITGPATENVELEPELFAWQMERAGSDAGPLDDVPVLQRDGFAADDEVTPVVAAVVADAADVDVEALAREHLAPEIPPWRWRPWAAGAALVLHLLVLLFILLFVRERPLPDDSMATGVNVTLDTSGAQQATAPPVTLHASPTPATAPPPSSPPPPPPAAAQPEVNLNMPPMDFSDMASAPTPPQPQPVQHSHTKSRPSPKYTMMPGMSLGSGQSEAPPSPPAPQVGTNLSLPQSDAQAALAPDITVKGDIGADWMAELNKWVNEHKYYPQAAAEQGQQGDVTIEFTVDRQGNVTGLKLLGSSGSPFLDQAWLGLFAQSTLPVFPPGTKANTVTVDATMHFILN